MIKFGFEKCLYNEKYSFKHYIKHRMGIDLVFLMIVITKTPKNSLGHIDPSKRIEHNFRVRVEVIPALTKKKMKMLNRLNFNCKFNVLFNPNSNNNYTAFIKQISLLDIAMTNI